jgi:GntR family transcriptional regulator, N-acetylglucosamine utilization regulator
VSVDGRRTSGGEAVGDPTSTWTDAALSDHTGVPLYVQIRRLLRERIRLGEWAADEPMPTEEELVAHFGVSRTTVRQALSDLANEGLVVRHAGRGTFARQPLMVVRMQQWHSLTTDIAQRGLRPSKRILRVEKLDARAEIAHRASELAESDILHVQSVRFADEIPIVVLDNYFPFELCAFLTEVELDAPDNSIEHALAEHGIELARANGEIAATVATREEAKHLDIEPGAPLVEIALKAYNGDGRVVEYSRGVVVGERYPLALYSDWSVEPGAITAPPRQPQ